MFCCVAQTCHSPVKRCAESRPSTPGDDRAVFGLVNIMKSKSGAVSGVTPVGSAFCISSKLVLTADHNVRDGKTDPRSIQFGLIKTLGWAGLKQSEVLIVSCIHHCVDEDWAVLQLAGDGEFDSFVQVCPEAELPKKRTWIGIKDFPAGLLSVNSTTKLEITSTCVKIQQYEPRELPGRKLPKNNKFPVVSDDKFVQRAIIEDVIAVECGRVMGSCGAPYFAQNGKVIAFQYESVDETPERGSVGSSSHISLSHGYVLCRLPAFWAWYVDQKGSSSTFSFAGGGSSSASAPFSAGSFSSSAPFDDDNL